MNDTHCNNTPHTWSTLSQQDHVPHGLLSSKTESMKKETKKRTGCVEQDCDDLDPDLDLL